VTSILTPEADVTGGTTVTEGDPAPMVDATTASNLPFAPDAMIAPAEFNMAERIVEAAGCGTLTVTTLKTSSCKEDLLLIETAPDQVTLSTGLLEESAAIVAEANTPPGGLISCPCAGPANDHPAPTRVITRTEGANEAGMLKRFGIKEMLTVDEDCMALFVNCKTGWPASIAIIFGTISTNDPDELLKIMF
jgi:hypothetical protein